MDWQPSCSPELLSLRAQTLQKIRRFFAERNVLEVETPLLCSAIGTDPNLDFFTTDYQLPPKQRTLFLQTSPEFAMKRLLAAGSGSIFQICKAFRNGESGRFHNPEFTLLEWYRVGFNLSQLMNEVDKLIAFLFDACPLQATQKVSYQSLFQQTTGLDPLVFSCQDYAKYAHDSDLIDATTLCGHDHVVWLDFIFSHQIQPHLGKNALCMVHGYPACMSSLARINQGNPLITDRVELFINGVELGNGYYELSDAKEQERRFDKEITIRQGNKRPNVVKDERLLAALELGLPDCSGIAIGLDRILMLLSNSATIDDVLAFSISKA
ncbi:EF-P lysine aminoacylase EpmA [Methyloglobulus sp.]|uniref:EF-P lysine aminoacylase EpmA n=1 Tax=Methyloglobulus sp. TaxID=2518622 RepID=UPI0032B7F4B0